VAVYDPKGRLVGMGLLDPASPIRVRMVRRGAGALDQAWWSEALARALGRRDGLFDDGTTGWRWVYGESDGLPGLVVDRYGTTGVVKVYSGAWAPHLGAVGAALRALWPEAAHWVVRWARNVPRGEGRPEGWWSWTPAGPADGPGGDGRVSFLEHGLAFRCDPVRGQKTGFFLDQRDNRVRLGAVSAGRSVLNLFSYSGGFSLHAARGGACRVVSVDVSPHAARECEDHFRRNVSLAGVAGCAHDAVVADAFDWLDEAARSGERFDIVVIDPPSMAQDRSQHARALDAYGRLAGLGARVTAPGGLLVLASCTRGIEPAVWLDRQRAAVARAGRRVVELEETGHPPDHPTDDPALRYLKCAWLRLDGESA
jgi:23S rRNA (cytosine1962-C5)-methyltransferase